MLKKETMTIQVVKMIGEIIVAGNWKEVGQRKKWIRVIGEE